jgi:Rab GDP dissociation inhibitor
LIINRVAERIGQNVRNSLYCIDRMPLAIFAQDELIQVLLNTNGTSSLSFFMVDGLYYRSDNSWNIIPCSKSAIFQAKSLSLKQKHTVMKFMSYCFPEAEYGHSSNTDYIAEKVTKFLDLPFADLLRDLGFDEGLRRAFEYLLALASDPLITKEAISRIRTFCTSIGRYGPSPLMFLGYGASDFPQIFCRFSAVYATTFVLGHYPLTKQPADDGFLDMSVNEIGSIRARTLIATPDHLFESESPQRLIAHREVLLVTKPILEEARSVAVIAPNEMGNSRPVYVVQLDYSTHCCQAGEYVVHVSSLSEVRAIVDSLIEDDDSVIMRAAFDITEGSGEVDGQTIVVNSPTIEELSFGTNWFLEQTKEILGRIAPDVAFYPPTTEWEICIADEAVGGDVVEERKENVDKDDVVAEKKEDVENEGDKRELGLENEQSGE